MNDYKRQYRELDDATKMKISNSSRNRTKSETHKEHISQGMVRYWKTVPSKPKTTDNDIV